MIDSGWTAQQCVAIPRSIVHKLAVFEQNSSKIQLCKLTTILASFQYYTESRFHLRYPVSVAQTRQECATLIQLQCIKSICRIRNKYWSTRVTMIHAIDAGIPKNPAIDSSAQILLISENVVLQPTENCQATMNLHKKSHEIQFPNQTLNSHNVHHIGRMTGRFTFRQSTESRCRMTLDISLIAW